jgi:hypothetical protein
MISRRTLEVATAALTGFFGAAVVVSSMDNGIGWSRAGVDAGTFPFLTGLIILSGSLYNLVRGALQAHQIAITWSDLRRLTALFIPAALYISVIPLLGMYLASGGYMFGTLALAKQRSWLRAVIFALATPLALYLVFERMFQVSLPHGVLGGALGF